MLTGARMARPGRAASIGKQCREPPASPSQSLGTPNLETDASRLRSQSSNGRSEHARRAAAVERIEHLIALPRVRVALRKLLHDRPLVNVETARKCEEPFRLQLFANFCQRFALPFRQLIEVFAVLNQAAILVGHSNDLTRDTVSGYDCQSLFGRSIASTTSRSETGNAICEQSIPLG